MKKLLVLFFILSAASFAQTKEDIINGFVKSLKKNDLVQYELKRINYYNNKTKINNYKISEIIVPEDTSIGGYYNYSSISYPSISIYNGKEHFFYNTDYLKEDYVEYFTRKKNPEIFKDTIYRTGNISGFKPRIERVKCNYEILLSYLRKMFQDKNHVANIKLLTDTTINGNTSSRINTKYYTFSFDKKSGLPLSASYDTDGKGEYIYSDYKINQGNKTKLFTKKAFPKNYIFTDDYEKLSKFQSLPVGTKAPDFEITSLNNLKVKMSELQGKPVLVYISAISCMFCAISLPEINEICKNYKDLTVLGIYPTDSTSDLKRYTSDYKVAFEIFPKTTDLAKKFGMYCYPSLFLIDRNGIIQFTSDGYYKDTKKKLIKEIEKALKKNI